jgi:hypothetical protein
MTARALFLTESKGVRRSRIMAISARGNLVRSCQGVTLLCVLAAQGCDFIGDVSLGNNDGKGGSVATGGSGTATGGSGNGGSDSGGSDDPSGGSAASGGTSNGGGAGSSSGGRGTAGAGEAGVPSGGSSSGGTPSGGAPQGGTAGSAAGASGAGAVGGAGAAAGAGGASGAGPGGAGGVGGAGGMASASYLGCTFIGGYDRIVVSKRDIGNNRCLGLVLWDGHTESGDIDVPERWAVETVVIGPADECPSRTGTRVEATVSGALTFLDQGTGAGPMHVAVDATITYAAGQPATGTERLIVESVDVRAACNAACVGVGPNPDCNDNPALSAIHGRCTAAGTCVCNDGYELNPATGKCL